jgi:hypothetical protein
MLIGVRFKKKMLIGVSGVLVKDTKRKKTIKLKIIFLNF